MFRKPRRITSSHDNKLFVSGGGKMKKICSRMIITIFCVGAVALSAIPIGHAANIAASGNADQSNLLKLTPGMSPATLAGRPDSTMVQLPSGRTIRLGRLRQISELSRKAKQVTAKPLPRSLSSHPAQTGLQVRNEQDLAAALKRTDNDTVLLPSGKRMTVGMLRYLQPLVEQRLGRKIAGAGSPPNRGAKIIKIKSTTNKKEWIKILQQPDSTILENPGGKRITVGELKLSLEKQLAGSRQPASKPVPVKR
jgi:hypothetical protein